MHSLRLARTRTATAVVAVFAALALASPLALANPSGDHKPIGAGRGKRVR